MFYKRDIIISLIDRIALETELYNKQICKTIFAKFM